MEAIIISHVTKSFNSGSFIIPVSLSFIVDIA